MSTVSADTREPAEPASVSAVSALAGLWAPAITPLGPDLGIDHAAYARHARWLLAQGCHGVVVFGTTGEATSFSVEERIALLDALLEAGIPGANLVAGTGCCALPDTVRLTAHAVRSGCAGVLTLPPFYFKGVSDEGLFRSYAELIERVGDRRLALYLYHFPRLSGVPVTDGLIQRLRQRYPDTLRGLKDSSGERASTERFLTRHPGLGILPGSEEYFLELLEEGAAGCITASANVNPAAIREVYDAWRRSSAEASRLQDRIRDARRTLAAHPLAPALKALLSHYRGEAGWGRVRPPLTELDQSTARELAATLEARGFRFHAEACRS